MNLTGMICGLFWYAIYALALLLLSASRIRLALDSSKRMAVQPKSKLTTAKSSLNYKTT